MAWTPNGNPRGKSTKIAEVVSVIAGWAIMIVGGLAAIGAYRQGKFDRFIDAFWAGYYQGAPVAHAASLPQASEWNCPESDGSATVYGVDPASRLVMVDSYNPRGIRFCRAFYKDGVTGPITKPEFCQPTNGAEVLAETAYMTLRIQQAVLTNGNTVSFGGLIVQGLGQGQRQFSTLNLSTGAFTDPYGGRMTCRLMN